MGERACNTSSQQPPLMQSIQEALADDDEETAFIRGRKGFIQTLEDFAKRQADGANDIQGLSPGERAEVIRILRKSGDFLHENEIRRLKELFGHIDFPAKIRIPGIHIEEEVSELLKKMFYRKVKAGSYIYNAGDAADEVYIVLAGVVDVDEMGIGSAKQSRTIDAGHLFGEDAGMGGADVVRTSMAIASEDVHLAGLDKSSINRVYNQQVDEEGDMMKMRFEREATGHLSGYFSGWEFVQEIEGVRVYKKDHPTLDTKFFKGIGRVEKPHEEVADYILDLQNRVDWDPLFMGGQTFNTISTSKAVRQDAFYTPSPLHYNRDFLTLYCESRDSEAGEHYGISTSIRSVFVKESRDFVRADMFDTGFKITKDATNPESSQVCFITQVDPKGHYPTWLIDRVNFQQATYIINIRKAMTRVLTQPRLKTMLLDKGMIFTVTTSFVNQQLDLWCFAHKNLNEVMCMNRTRRINKQIIPLPGNYLYSQQGQKLLVILEDNTSEKNVFTNNAYGFRSYSDSDAEEVHQNCSDHLHEQLMELGLSPPHIPLPWSLFHDVSSEGMEYQCLPSRSPAGSRIRMRALEDVVMVVGSCHCNCDETTAHESMINVASALNYYPPLEFANAPRQIGEVRIE